MVRPDLIIARRDHAQYWALCILSAAVLLATLILVAFGRPVFGRFIGSVNPLFAVLTASLILAAITPFGLKKGVFKICGEKTAGGILLAAGTASIFGMIIIIADMKIVFPRDMNVLFPESLLFYPVIGYGVEVLFHALPLVVIALAVATQAKRRKFMFAAILLVAAIEPVFHALDGLAEGYPNWLAAFVFAHVFAINVCQLAILRRYDFISMYAFRLAYYLIWHIGWGYFRLQVLF